ncbi:MAG TPA: translation initiation factor IF-2 [Candidatus Babeliales bacterium]|jgi:translation initiation factor IF-2|nr:translation initiation factor IF-2 [Candidatus Babeliales bacterium]
MRIYEFAQLHNVSSKDLIEKLQKQGFDVKSHMSVLDDKALSFLNKSLTPDKNAHKDELKESKSPSTIENAVLQTSPATVKKSLKNSEKISKKETPRQESGKKDSVQKEKNTKDKSEDKQKEAQKEIPVELILHQMSISDFADTIKKPVTDVIITLLKWGIMATKNQIISESIVQRLADHYEISIVKAADKQEKTEVRKQTVSNAVLEKRPPVVVVVGHVDHGKTTLLDYIRKTRVAFKEKGGITQHLGAYEAKTSHGNIVFLDTPGHEAFVKIRQRGIKVADIVILIVAADDGVMPQTVEAIKYALSTKVPIVVAINKVDRVDAARLDVVKRQLNQHGITVEDWGGDVICVPISAKDGTGVDRLLEMLSLQAEMMELRAEINVPANGYILESSVEVGRGCVATVIAQNGILKVGDYMLCGNTTGHISSLFDSYGKRIKEVHPSIPAQAAGFDGRPEAGDFFRVVSKEEYLKIRSSGGETKTSLAGKRLMYEKGLNVIVKTDNHSSLEAVVEEIDRLSKKVQKGFNILRQEVGNVNESDIEFAFNSGARIVCFNVKIESNAQDLADRKKVSILSYGIIYKLLEGLHAIAESEKDIEMIRTKIGEATVLRVFDIKKIGVIAGSIVRDGKFTREGYVTIWRGKTKVGEGKISSLQRDKKTVKEVLTGFECAFMVHNFSEWLEGDRVECFIDIPKK